MQKLLLAGRNFYGIGIAGIGVQQFIHGDFRAVLIPEWPSFLIWMHFWAYIVGAALVIAGGVLIFISKMARITSLILGFGFLWLFLSVQLTYQLFFSPFGFHLALWTDPLKELALSGGAFVIAGSFPERKLQANKTSFEKGIDSFIAVGSILFSIALIVLGIDHFIYSAFVATLIPAWIPWHLFWTYFAGVSLISSGIFIIFKIWLKIVGLLLGIMLFLWFVLLHIPRAIADPYVDNGTEVTSLFEALAFSGIACIIACMPYGRIRKVNTIN